MKYFKRILFLLLIIVLIPKNVNATTLKEYEDQVKKYTAELQEKQAKLAKNDQEIAQINRKSNKNCRK